MLKIRVSVASQVIYPERAELRWDTVEGVLRLADMYGMGSVRVACRNYNRAQTIVDPIRESIVPTSSVYIVF